MPVTATETVTETEQAQASREGYPRSAEPNWRAKEGGSTVAGPRTRNLSRPSAPKVLKADHAEPEGGVFATARQALRAGQGGPSICVLWRERDASDFGSFDTSDSSLAESALPRIFSSVRDGSH